MTTDPKPRTNSSTARRRALRGGTALTVIASLLGGLLLLVDFEEERPNFYEPARAPLTEAAMILSQTYGQEKELIEKLQIVHSRLNQAIGLLGKAERLDPADKHQIETLQVRLQALEDTNRIRKTNPMALQRAYRDLTGQLDALAKKLAKPGA